jgi:GntR family transcriptional regulator
MVIRIDPSDGRPLFAQIVESVKRSVGTGSLKAGDRLPSVRELAKELVINPNTIAHAYQVLEAEGVTVSRRGSGTFIAERRPRVRDEERRRRIGAALDELLTEATHLGASESELRESFEDALERYRGGLGEEES